MQGRPRLQKIDAVNHRMRKLVSPSLVCLIITLMGKGSLSGLRATNNGLLLCSGLSAITRESFVGCGEFVSGVGLEKDLYLYMTLIIRSRAMGLCGRVVWQLPFTSKVSSSSRLALCKEFEEAGDSVLAPLVHCLWGRRVFHQPSLRRLLKQYASSTASESSSFVFVASITALTVLCTTTTSRIPRGGPSFVYRLRSLVGFLTLNPFSCCPTVASPFPAHHQLRAQAVSLSPTNVLLLRGHVLSTRLLLPFTSQPSTGLDTNLLQPDTSPGAITHCLFHRRQIHLLTRPQTKRHSLNSHRIFTCPTARSARHLCRKWRPVVVIRTVVANQGSAVVRSLATHSPWQLLQ
jgi:hypothetical protein